MKKLIIVTMIAACVALCAAVRLHGNAVGETPVPAAKTAVSAKEATVAEIEEPAALAEKEKETIPPQNPDRKTAGQAVEACPAVCIVIVNSFEEGKCKQTGRSEV
jgi:ferredoxin